MPDFYPDNCFSHIASPYNPKLETIIRELQNSIKDLTKRLEEIEMTLKIQQDREIEAF